MPFNVCVMAAIKSIAVEIGDTLRTLLRSSDVVESPQGIFGHVLLTSSPGVGATWQCTWGRGASRQ